MGEGAGEGGQDTRKLKRQHKLLENCDREGTKIKAIIWGLINHGKGPSTRTAARLGRSTKDLGHKVVKHIVLIV